MNPLITKLFVALFLSSIFSTTLAQKGRMEKIAMQCKDILLADRTVVAVSSFTNSAATEDVNKLRPAGLVDMLTNALFNTGCYSVLERKNLNEIIREQDFSNSKKADRKTKISN